MTGQGMWKLYRLHGGSIAHVQYMAGETWSLRKSQLQDGLPPFLFSNLIGKYVWLLVYQQVLWTLNLIGKYLWMLVYQQVLWVSSIHLSPVPLTTNLLPEYQYLNENKKGIPPDTDRSHQFNDTGDCNIPNIHTQTHGDTEKREEQVKLKHLVAHQFQSFDKTLYPWGDDWESTKKRKLLNFIDEYSSKLVFSCTYGLFYSLQIIILPGKEENINWKFQSTNKHWK